MKSKIKADKRWPMAIPLAILFVVLTIITTAGSASAQCAASGYRPRTAAECRPTS